MLIVDETNTQYDDRIGRIDKGVKIYPFLTEDDPEVEQGIAGYISVHHWDIRHSERLEAPEININVALGQRYGVEQVAALRDALDKAIAIANADEECA